MYARSTIFRSDPSRVEAGIEFIRDEVAPALDRIDGCIGQSLMVDRTAGRTIVTSAWTDEDKMTASEPRVASLRARGSQVLGVVPTVQVWEIAVVHRVQQARPGVCVRATWTRIDPSLEERSIGIFRTVLIPAMEQLPGFCSCSLFVDREAGRAVSTVTYDSRANLDASRTGAASLRRTAVEENDLEVLEVAEFDLVLAHLRVPELV
jgi:quinol monooxygenase YgiN